MFTKKVNTSYTIKINLSYSISDGPQDKQNIDLYINSNQENNLSAKNVSDQTDENWNYWVFLPGKNHKKIKGSVFYKYDNTIYEWIVINLTLIQEYSADSIRRGSMMAEHSSLRLSPAFTDNFPDSKP